MSAGSPELIELSKLMTAANGYLATGEGCTFAAALKASQLTLTVESGLDAVTLQIPSSATVQRTATGGDVRFALAGIGSVVLGDDSVTLTDSTGAAATCSAAAE